MKWLLLAAPLLLAAMLAGCASPAYYVQAIGGQLQILRASRPLADALVDPAVPADVRQRLAVAAQMRVFASRELGLPDNDSYRKYADLGRPYVAWDVFAAKPLSVELKRWCFPIAGCVGYRGYFSEAAAREFAADLRAAGDDAYVGAVPAYSTLGWFDDPILNTFIHYPDIELARLLFHELAHQIVYVSGDTTFNESFAVTVEEAGVTRWLDTHGTAAQREEFIRREERRRDFHALVKAARDRLAHIYAGPGTTADKLAEKARALAQIQEDYRALRNGRWGGFAGYDRWFAGDVNNATLASIGLYLDRVPAFQVLLAENGNDLRRFYAAVRALAALPAAQREAQLAAAAARAPKSAH
ncbi:MAG: aminopeptidase [Rhodocyclaceae bacterium]|nr:aminopeptidase [Rhodocyclaceae bacterium]